MYDRFSILLIFYDHVNLKKYWSGFFFFVECSLISVCLIFSTLTRLSSYFPWTLGKNVTEVKCAFCHIMWREDMVSVYMPGFSTVKLEKLFFPFHTLCFGSESSISAQTQGVGDKLHLLEGIFTYIIWNFSVRKVISSLHLFS